MNKKLKIGFADNLYGTPKGHSYVVRDMVKLLKDVGHEIHMFRIGNNPLGKEFTKPDTIKSCTGKNISKEEFVQWTKEKELDYCVFMEYRQWWQEDYDKIQVCKDMDIKTVGFLVYEKLDWDKIEHYKLYTKIICPTGFQTRLMRKKGLMNAVHTPWGVFKDEIDEVFMPDRKDDKVLFYHCAGSGGVENRKNTEAVIEAYKQVQDENTDLKISHLGNKIFGRTEIISFMKHADVLLNAAKWDTIGLNTLEANMCGRPVIVVDMDPMNELVKPNVNGFIVKGNLGKSEIVTCPVYNVDVDELAKKMNMCKNKMILDSLKRSSRKFAELNFDWEINKEFFLKHFK